MKAYIINLIVCIILSIFADLSFKRNKKRLGIIFIALVVFLTALLAAVRSESVGTDIHNYVTALFKLFHDYHYSIMGAYSKYGTEIGFTSLVYFFSKFGTLSAVLFGIQLGVSVPVGIYCYKRREEVPIVINVFIFLMTIYCFSFNMMRQSIAITIGLLAMYFIRNKQKKVGLFCIVLSYLFHRTAIVLVAFYILCNIIYSKKRDVYFFLYVIIIGSIALSVLSPKLVLYLPIKYSSYLSDRYVSSVNFLSMLKKVIWLLPIGIYMNRIKDKDTIPYRDLLYALILIIFDITIYLIGIKIPTVSRLSLYFSYIACFIYFPYLIKMFKPKFCSFILFVLVLFGMWWHMTVTDTSASIYPYESDMYPFLNSATE